MKSDEQRIIEALDCFHWITNNNLELSHGPWDLLGHEYQVPWLQCDAPEQCFIKGAQIGVTEALVLKTLHGLIHGKYNAGALYLFPTRDDVKDFSKARFDPLIEANSFIKDYVQNTDAQNIKQIGRGFLYLRGARSTKTVQGSKKSSSQLKSIPVDRVVFDERDEMDDAMVELARERVSHSRVKEVISLGTPTIPDYGIDAQYKLSDQRVWYIKCDHCGKETCLEIEFPNGLTRRRDGTVFRSCVHCGKEIFPHNGKWIALYPDKSKTLVGWWISQLNSIYMEPQRILELYEDPPNGDLSEVMNSKLGRAYIPAENRLTINDVYSCCTTDMMMSKSEGPSAMGVDVGRELHVVIAVKKSKYTIKVIWCGRVGDFNDLHDLSIRFGVKSAVIDIKPEIRKVREFQKAEPYSIFACDYVETRVGMTQWDEKDRVIKCNRTEICDATHQIITEPGRLELPRRNTELDQFAKEITQMAKVLEEDNDTGAKVYRYKKLGADHYRHALNYCMLAAERVGNVNDNSLISRFFGARRGRTAMTA
jgi:hypothetical protein